MNVEFERSTDSVGLVRVNGGERPSEARVRCWAVCEAGKEVRSIR
jgi:hypothetical protein